MGTLGFLPGRPAAIPTYGYTVVRSFPHDRQAFTQGLIFRNGFLYESTGLFERSGIRKIKLETGEVLQAKPLGPQYFGEGITDWKGSLIQITWQSQIGFVYDIAFIPPYGTLRVGDRLWEVDSKLAGSRVLVRFNPSAITRVLYRPLGDSAVPWGTAFLVQ